MAAPTPVAAAEQSDPDLGPFAVHLLTNKTEMEMAGDMNGGVTSAVRRLLDANPGIQVIHLNSPGGDAHEGYILGLLIKERHLATYTSTICASACTEAFLSGSPRYLAKGAKLGFHSGSQAIGGASWDLLNDAMRTVYRNAGVPDAFIDRALHTPPSDIWIPTDEELRAAHVVDEIVDKSKFAISGTGYWQSADEVDEALKTNTLYGAIAAHDPAAYADIRSIFLKGAKAGRDTAEIQDEATKLIVDKLLPGYLAKAPDPQIRHYFTLRLNELEYLSKNDPHACAAIAFPALRLSVADARESLSPSLADDDFAIMTDVVQTALAQPQPVADSGEVGAKLQAYFHKLGKSAPDAAAIVQQPQAHRSEPEKLCRAAISAFQTATDLPPQETMVIQRQLLVMRD